MDFSFLTLQLLNALQYSMLLFLLSVGLTVIFGLLHFVNLAHGAFYMLGAYIGVSLFAVTNSFWLTLLLVPLVIALIGAFLYCVLIHRLRRSSHMNHVLVTFGLIFVLLDVVRIVWGDIALGLDVPPVLQGVTAVFAVQYPTYRLFIIAVGLLVMSALWLLLRRTQIGAMIRAGVENESMAAALGINVTRLFFMVFCVGCALAGLAGVIAAPIFSANTGMSISILVPTLIVVVIGGLGSLEGAIVGSLIIGSIETIGAVYLPEISAIISYVLLATVLICKPQGLIPARG